MMDEDKLSNNVNEGSVILPPEGSVIHMGADTEDDADGDDQNKMKGKDKIEALVRDFEEMIQFMDFSFETAFQQKDNEFMVAYRDHIKSIQIEIDKIKGESNDAKYTEKKKEKI